MRERTRKILKRMGAGLLLGLSFLNFGTGWGRQKAKSVPRRAQNIRKETKEELDTEIQQVADLAEKEAEDVINQVEAEQQQMQQMQMQAQSQTRAQQLLRHATVGGWGVAMAVFFTSMVFNSPFSLGKAVLSLLPGEPHVAVLKAVSEKDIWQVGDTVVIDIQLATNQEKVNYFKADLSYNPKVLKFQKIIVDRNKFDRLEQNRVDQEKGRIIFSLRKKEGEEEFKKDIIAKVVFEAVNPSQKTEIALRQADSLVLKTKREDGKGYNILGRTVSANMKIVDKMKVAVNCQKIDIVESRMTRQEWERLIKGAPVPVKDGSKWIITQEKDVSARCSYSDDGYLYFLLRGKGTIGDVELTDRITGRKATVVKTEEWQEGDGNFYAVTINPDKWIKEKPGVYRGIVINFDYDGKRVRWPQKGLLDLELK